jgi:hypothetical protein
MLQHRRVPWATELSPATQETRSVRTHLTGEPVLGNDLLRVPCSILTDIRSGEFLLPAIAEMGCTMFPGPTSQRFPVSSLCLHTYIVSMEQVDEMKEKNAALERELASADG